MLLIMCHCGGNRYAIDSRHVCEVLPRVHLHRLGGLPPWLAGMLIYRGRATPVMDLRELTEGGPCVNRLGGRIVVLRIDLRGSQRSFGLLVESVDIQEIHKEPERAGDAPVGPSELGTLHLDEQGLFHLVATARLVSQDREAILFGAEEKGLACPP
jgi:chemotaxis-related protein WspB